MPTPTFVPLSTYTVPSTTTSITLSGISTSYRHLYMTISHQPSTNSQMLFMRPNGVPNAYGFGNTRLAYRNGGSKFGGNGTINEWNLKGISNSDYLKYNSSSTLFMNYSQTTVTRMHLTRSTSGNQAIGMLNQTYTYAPNGATSSINIYVYDGSIAAGMVISLYGIAG